MTVETLEVVDEAEEIFSIEDTSEFWTSLLRGSIGAVLAIIVAKVGLTIAYAFWSGFEIGMERIFGFLPQFVFGIGQERFEHMVRVSWLLSSVGAVVWWCFTAISQRGDRREVERLRAAASEASTEAEREDLQYRLFVADAQRVGGWLGMWIGSLSLLMIVAFEYGRRWLIDDIQMPPFPVAVLLVASVPVAMLTIELVKWARCPVLRAVDIAGLLESNPAVAASGDE